MQYPIGTRVKFAGLSATVVANWTSGPYPTTRIQYDATGNRETVASDALVRDDNSE